MKKLLFVVLIVVAFGIVIFVVRSREAEAPEVLPTYTFEEPESYEAPTTTDWGCDPKSGKCA